MKRLRLKDGFLYETHSNSYVLPKGLVKIKKEQEHKNLTSPDRDPFGYHFNSGNPTGSLTKMHVTRIVQRPLTMMMMVQTFSQPPTTKLRSCHNLM